MILDLVDLEDACVNRKYMSDKCLKKSIKPINNVYVTRAMCTNIIYS